MFTPIIKIPELLQNILGQKTDREVVMHEDFKIWGGSDADQ
jgi:hypothetical protein